MYKNVPDSKEVNVKTLNLPLIPVPLVLQSYRIHYYEDYIQV
jgi:hypothetical protein